MPYDREDDATDETVDMDALIELSRKVKDLLRELVPDWQARGLIDERWLQAYEASLDDPMCPPPPPPLPWRVEGGDTG